MRTGPGPCPDEDTLLAFLQGRPSPTGSNVGAHLAACANCAEVATWAAAEPKTATPSDAPVPWSTSTTDLAGGAQLAPGGRVDRYHILGAIGRGGMGEVYAAYHPDLDRRIALKVVYGARAADPERQARLLREAQIIARLSHPNIVSVYDAGMVGDQVYVVMEFVDGQTLDEWLRELDRPWQDILDVFVAAGRGLAAAHAANLVHRDFKPQNMMIGRDGRVRVMDFGLARPVRGAQEPPLSTRVDHSSKEVTSTTVGALVGTPAYMAPEQLRGADVDMRADQFSFCVALHEAVYGQRPSLPATDSRGARRAPAWLRGLIRRGLEVDRQKRFPSMQDLLRAMERRRKPVRRPALTSTLAVLLGSAIVLGVRMSNRPRFACTPPQARIEAVWPAAGTAGSKREALRRLFLRSGSPAAEGTWKRIAASIDARLRRWSAMYQDACEATHVRGEQSAQVLDLRMTCLTDSLDETRAYVDGLFASDPSQMGPALASAAELPSVERCANLRDLRAQMPLPTEPRVRREVERLEQAINDAEALRSLRYEERAEKQLKSLLPEIRTLGYKPLLAQALEKLAMAQGNSEHYDDARATALETLHVAEASRDDLALAFAADALGWINGDRGHLGEAKQWLEFGHAAIERAGAKGALIEGWLLNDRGNVEYQEGRFGEAERDLRSAITIKTAVVGARHPDVAGSMTNLALDLEELDRWDDADTTATAALRIDEENGNQRSRGFAIDLTALGDILVHSGRLEEGQAALARALSLEQELGDTDLVMTVTLTSLGHVLLVRRHPSDALDVLRRAQALQSRVRDGNSVRLALTAFELGCAMVETGADVLRGKQLAEDACGTLTRGGFMRNRREILEWSQRLAARDREQIEQACSGAG